MTELRILSNDEIARVCGGWAQRGFEPWEIEKWHKINPKPGLCGPGGKGWSRIRKKDGSPIANAWCLAHDYKKDSLIAGGASPLEARIRAIPEFIPAAISVVGTMAADRLGF